MKNYLTQNTKLKKDGIFAFGLPAVKTCPFAGLCKQYCYAQKGNYARFPAVKKAQLERLKLTKRKDFAVIMSAEIKRRKVSILRIHDTGDFYSFEYLLKWFGVMNQNPKVLFYAYTKSLPYFLEPGACIAWPKNFKVIYSEGGKYDALINPDTMTHARIFQDKESLERCGYVNASDSDLIALNTKSTRIGLIFH